MKMKRRTSNLPTTVDMTTDIESIGSLFHEKYKTPYNCVEYDEHMAALQHGINTRICEHDTSSDQVLIIITIYNTQC